MKILTEATFPNAVKKRLLLIDFHSPDCIPCMMMNNNLKKLEQDIKLDNKVRFEIAKVNIDVEESLDAKFDIESVPTLVLLYDGAEIGRVEGTKTPKAIKEFIGRCIQKFKS